MILTWLLALALAAPGVQAGNVSSTLREESFQSIALGRSMRYRILVPQDYDASAKKYPVLYLLHGLGGGYKDWSSRTRLADYAKTLSLLIVMPDGENQWYTNAADGSAKFEDYIANDLPADVSQKFRTLNARHGRAIAGLSMGGFGALKIALKAPAEFAVAASFSGAFAVTREGALEPMIGATEADRVRRILGPALSETRMRNDVFVLAAAVRPADAPYIFMSCGTSDALVDGSREVAATLRKAGVVHEYREAAGNHTWDYWDRSIQQFLPVLMKRMAN